MAHIDHYREWRARQLTAYTTIEPREDWWHLPDGRTLHVVCEQHPFGGVTYLYENVTDELALESRYNELIGVQRETLDNLEEGIALLGSDGRLKLYNPAFARFWQLDPEVLDTQPHIEELAQHGGQLATDSGSWDEVRYSVTRLDAERKPITGKIDVSNHVLQFVAVPLPDGNTLLTFADISDSARMERALRDRADALEAVQRTRPDIVLLDVMMPGIDGIEVCRRIKGNPATQHIPVIMVTALDQPEDRVRGLEAGADDYLIKPFAIQELEARIRALIRRERRQVSTEVYKVADLILDTGSLRATRGGHDLTLSPIALRLLGILMRESPRVVTRRDIEREIWGDELPESDTLRSHLYNLRKAVDRGFEKQLLHTVQTAGYRIVDLDEQPKA